MSAEMRSQAQLTAEEAPKAATKRQITVGWNKVLVSVLCVHCMGKRANDGSCFRIWSKSSRPQHFASHRQTLFLFCSHGCVADFQKTSLLPYEILFSFIGCFAKASYPLWSESQDGLPERQASRIQLVAN